MGLTGSGGELPLDMSDIVVIPEAALPVGGQREGLLEADLWQLAGKRLVDVVGSIGVLILLGPVLLVVAIAVALTSPGPIFYRQRRIGRNGEPFTMYKFRSMCENAHEMRDVHGHMNEATGPIFKIRRDPRLTAVGRVIRRSSLDELPQLVNVLLGHMSLVGPRPPLPEEFELYGEREMGRLLVKPGITCTWQVSGRSDLDFDTWVDMDLEYIRSWTLRQDLLLLLRTVPAVLSGKGAY